MGISAIRTKHVKRRLFARLVSERRKLRQLARDKKYTPITNNKLFKNRRYSRNRKFFRGRRFPLKSAFGISNSTHRKVGSSRYLVHPQTNLDYSKYFTALHSIPAANRLKLIMKNRVVALRKRVSRPINTKRYKLNTVRTSFDSITRGLDSAPVRFRWIGKHMSHSSSTDFTSYVSLFYLMTGAPVVNEDSGSHLFTSYIMPVVSPPKLQSNLVCHALQYIASKETDVPCSSEPLHYQIVDLYFVKFFTRRYNLPPSSKRMALPITRRRSVTGSTSLSIDTYSTNYFSHKLYTLEQYSYNDLVRYSHSLNLKGCMFSFLKQRFSSLDRGFNHYVSKPEIKSPSVKSFDFINLKNFRNFKAHKRFKRKLRLTMKFQRKLRRKLTARPFRLRRRKRFLTRFLRKLKLKSKFIKHKLIRKIVMLSDAGLTYSRLFSITTFLLYRYNKSKVRVGDLTSDYNFLPQRSINPFAASYSCTYRHFSHLLTYDLLTNPFLLKLSSHNFPEAWKNDLLSFGSDLQFPDNIQPLSTFNKLVVKKIKRYVTSSILNTNITPWHHNTLIRFFEHCSGRYVMLQYYLSVASHVDNESVVLYKRWIPRMASYERKLGHRFFFEESLHIMHLSFRLHDVSLIAAWLKAMINRISFWKTRSIFRFLKYLFNNYVESKFDYLGARGIKIRLKGKISAAGNSRKRNIIFRSGATSYSSVNLKCLSHFSTITTFTGVMGFQVWLFY